MKGVAIYLEGGGDTLEGKARLRKGMNTFLAALRDRRGPRRLHWTIIPCGNRTGTYDAFQDGLRTDPDTFHVLLVDAEDAVSSSPMSHLQRHDGWTVAGLDGDSMHLMVQTMETWLVADVEALVKYYGKNFNSRTLPTTADLEALDKSRVADALARATRNTSKGAYHKIRHASDLLARIDAEKVKEPL
jgi:hypothetical protein